MIDIDHTHTDDITCPWCGESESDSWERRSDDGIDTCESCGKDFEWSRNVFVNYSTEKREVKS